MQLVTLVQEVLASGELSMSDERRMQSLLAIQTLTENEMTAIEALIAAIHRGEIRSVPDREMPPCP